MVDSAGAPIAGNSTTVEVIFYRIRGGTGDLARTASGPALHFGAGLPDGGVWVAYTDFDASGVWAMDVIARRPDGRVGRARLNVQIAARTLAPRAGDPAPFTDTPASPPAELASITSDPSPDPGLYDETLAQALQSGMPVVVHFGSPGHCSSPLCAATLAEIKAVAASYGDRVRFLHVETRDAADPTELTAATEAWRLPSEPWTFVLDRNGRVRTRVEGGLDRTELELLLDRMLGG
jgi:hypothetical protein